MITIASSKIQPNFTSNRLQQSLLAGYVAVWGWAAINPVYPFDWFLENILIIVALISLGTTYRQFPLSDVSYMMIFVFLVLHTIGIR